MSDTMPDLISYAQNFEDIILWRALGHIEAGCYVDVGAQSPDTDSVSRVFFEHGWRGVHVEPTPHYAGQLRERRPDELVLQAAIAEEAGALRFFEIADTGLSTTDESIAKEHETAGFSVRETAVPAITLDSLLQHVGDRPIHWLKIDVEGAELSVLRGWKSSPQRPWILVIESTRPLSPQQAHHEWEPLVIEKGYEFAYFDGLNRFYVHEQHAELLQAFTCGPNVFDNFSLSSHSTFCAAVNITYHELEQCLEQVQQQAAAERDAQQSVYASELETLRAGSERELVALRAEKDEEITRQQEQVAALSGEVESLMARAESLTEENAQVRRAIQRKVEQARANAQQELEAADKRIDELAHEAHRWWVEAETLRAQVRHMETSHSWRITAPMRGIRRRGGRIVRGTVTTTKRVLRPLLVDSLRGVLARPGLRAWLKPHVARYPAINNRLVALASHEQLFKDDHLRMAMLGGAERTDFHVHLDKRASAVWTDLDQALRKEGKP